MFSRKNVRDLLSSVNFHKTGIVKVRRVEPPFVKVRSFHIDSDIQYRYAKTVVTCTIANTSTKSGEIYCQFVVPETAFISGLKIEANDGVYNAYVKEKEENESLPKETCSVPRTRAQVENIVRDSNILTVPLILESNTEGVFTLTYEEVLRRELGAYHYYVNINYGQTVPNMTVKVSILEAGNIKFLKTGLSHGVCEFDKESDEEDKYTTNIEYLTPHKAIVSCELHRHQQLELCQNKLQGQLVISYDLDRTAKPEEILVWDPNGSDEIPQEWITAKGEPADTPCQHGPLAASTIVPATAANVEKAKKFIESLKAYSTTDIHGALFKGLEAAYLGKTLNSLVNTGEQVPEPIIIFLTDGTPNGKINDLEHIISEVTSGNSGIGASIFSLGFGKDVDMSFLKKLSLCNSGFARKIYEADDAAVRLKDVYQQVALPCLTDVKFKYEDDKVDLNSVSRTSFPAYFCGSELVVCGHLHRCCISGQLAFRSRYGVSSESFAFPQILPDEAKFMERMWAFVTIQQLVDSMITKGEKKSEYLKAKALQLSLKYSFVTPLTSLVTVKPNDEAFIALIEKGDDIRWEFLEQAYSRRHKNRKSKYSGLPYDPLAPPPTSRYRRLYKMTRKEPKPRSRLQKASQTLERLARLTLSTQRNSTSDIGPELNVVSRVKFQHSVNEITIIIPASSFNMLNGDLRLPIPDEAVITGCTFEVGEKQLKGVIKDVEEGKVKFDTCTGNAALFYRPAEQRDLFISLHLARDENVTLKVTYEQIIHWAGLCYEHYLVTDVNDIIKKVSVQVYIEECYRVIDVKSFLRGDQSIFVGSMKEYASNRVTVSWCADETKIEELKHMNSFGKFFLWYNVDKADGSREIITTPCGYPIHRCHKNILLPEIHWILVLDPELKEEGLKFIEALAVKRLSIVLSPTDVMILQPHSETSAVEPAKNFLMGITTPEENNLLPALLKAIDMATGRAERFSSVIIVLASGYVNPALVGVVTTANIKRGTPIFCLTYDNTEGQKYLKNVAYRNWGIARILYSGCDFSFQIKNFVEDLRNHLAAPVKFRYMEDEPYLDEYWKKLCIQMTIHKSEVATEILALALQESVVSPATSVLAMKFRTS